MTQPLPNIQPLPSTSSRGTAIGGGNQNGYGTSYHASDNFIWGDLGGAYRGGEGRGAEGCYGYGDGYWSSGAGNVQFEGEEAG